jgi:pimeloyl-ACP methyl ester carboxylesterase
MKLRMGAVAMAAILSMAAQRATAVEKWQSIQPSPMPAPRASGYASVNGIAMYYAIFGRGEPILLVPIGMAPAEMWAAVIPVLSQHHEVIAADTRGHGRSTRTAAAYSYALLAADYLALLDHLHINKVALIGASDGAIIGLEIAMHHPERLTKLFAQGANATPDGLFADAADPTASKAAARLWAEQYHRLSKTPDEYAAFHRAMKLMWDSQPNYTTAQLSGTRVPTAIVICDHDEWVKPEHAQYLARTIPGARTLTLHGVSHYAALQDPQAYASAVLTFLDSPAD